MGRHQDVARDEGLEIHEGKAERGCVKDLGGG
jgi:hypothetical protein